MCLYNNPVSWIKQFLASRGLNYPNGKALYTYRMSDSEFLQLKDLLQHSKFSVNSSNSVLPALFCLYSAEWYRREYSGQWTWDGIEKSLNIKLEPNVRTDIIQRGFKYWKREIVQYSEHHRSYLGSVYREGGLPYALLISEDSRFQDLFRKILEFISQNPQIVLNPSLLTPYVTYFPKALNNETTLSLITEMAMNLATLVEKYTLSNQQSPASYLDSVYPDWRLEFPIPLNNDSADKLLLNLLNSSIKVRRDYTKSRARYTLHQYLIDTDKLKFRVEIHFAKEIPIKPQYTLSQARCLLSLYEGNTCLKQISSAYVTSNNEVISLRQTECDADRNNPELPLFLVLEQQGIIVYQEMISESEIDLNEMPLVLSADIKQKVIGAGSVQKEAELLYLVVKERADIHIQDEHSELVENGCSNGIKHYLLAGRAIVYYGNEKFYISSQHEKIRNQIRLVGSMLPYLTPNGRPIYLGIPKISQANDEFYLDMGQQDNANLVYGDKYARILDKKNNLIFKQKMAVLPEDFKIKFNKSKTANPKEGSIEFCSEKNFVIYKPNNAELECEIEKNHNSKQLSVRNIGTFKSKLKLGISIDLQSKVEMVLPFPSTGVQIIDSNHKEIAMNQTLSTQELLGSRIILYPEIEAGMNYSIDFENSQRNNYNFKYEVKNVPLEVSLNEFRTVIYSLFSSSKSLDEQITLMISQGSSIVKQINIMLYKTGIKIVDGYIAFDSIEYTNDIQLELLSLTTLECFKLKKCEAGQFILPAKISSPSLIIPSADSRLQSRAVFVPETMKSEIDGELELAIVSDPSSYTAKVQYVLDKMAKDFYHTGWNYLNNLYQKFNYLPLSTFLVWKELVKNSNALSAFVLQHSETEKVIDHLQSEFNVIWSMIPLNSWLESLNSWEKKLGIPKEFFNLIRDNKINQLDIACPIFQDKFPTIPEEIVRQAILPNWYRDLKSKNAGRHWIRDFGEELSAWATIENIDLNFTVEHTYQQAVVFFPFFAAAVACGATDLHSLRPLEDKDFYTFKMLMEFDLEWFNPVYLYAIQLFKR